MIFEKLYSFTISFVISNVLMTIFVVKIMKGKPKEQVTPIIKRIISRDFAIWALTLICATECVSYLAKSIFSGIASEFLLGEAGRGIAIGIMMPFMLFSVRE